MHEEREEQRRDVEVWFEDIQKVALAESAKRAAGRCSCFSLNVNHSDTALGTESSHSEKVDLPFVLAFRPTVSQREQGKSG